MKEGKRQKKDMIEKQYCYQCHVNTHTHSQPRTHSHTHYSLFSVRGEPLGRKIKMVWFTLFSIISGNNWAHFQMKPNF